MGRCAFDMYTYNQLHFVVHRLENLEEELIMKKVKLVILDSVASLVRKEFDSRGTRNIVDRTNLLAKEASILKYIAEEFQIPVSNQFPLLYAHVHHWHDTPS